MKFDKVIISRCLSLSSDAPDACPHGDDSGGDDDSGQYLILKPEYVLKESGQTIQYRTYLVGADGSQVEVTDGLIYRSSNPGVVIIGVRFGNATAGSAGIANISVEWNGMFAYAQAEVIDGCDSVRVGMVIAVDNSKSMSQVFTTASTPGQDSYNTKLSFARSLSSRFAKEITNPKDMVGALYFNSGPTLIKELEADGNDVSQAILGIAPSTRSTDIYAGLKAAINELDGSDGLDKKVVVLLSDGVNKGDNDPVALATTFKANGGVIVVVGCRASGVGFRLLQDISSDGMFLNGLGSNSTTTSDLLSGLKGYFCAGNCTSPFQGYTTAPVLNYEGLTNWETHNVSGPVDLIGKGEQVTAFNFIPGNGLYIDLAGSSAPWKGQLISKIGYSLGAGEQYRLTVNLAGNQRVTGAQSVQFKLGNFLSWVVDLPDYTQDFKVFTHDWTVATGEFGGKLIITLQTVLAAFPAAGPLLGYVKLEKLTPFVLLLEDNFDNENHIYIPGRCSQSGTNPGLYYDGCYNDGCLDEPPVAQIPDPNPLPDVE